MKARGEIRTQYHHAIDVAPTILDALNVEPPATIKGYTQSGFDGVSMRYSFDDAKATGTRTTQFYSMLGSRAIWHEGWKAVTNHPAISGWGHFEDDEWELYHTDIDRSETHNLASERPDTASSAASNRPVVADRDLPVGENMILSAAFDKQREDPPGVAVGVLSLYHGETKVGETPIKTQPGKVALGGEGLCIGRDGGAGVTNDYPGEMPWRFTGGTIHRVAVDVSGEPYVDLEREAQAMLMRE